MARYASHMGMQDDMRRAMQTPSTRLGDRDCLVWESSGVRLEEGSKRLSRKQPGYTIGTMLRSFLI
jgi:hypothetical protein